MPRKKKFNLSSLDFSRDENAPSWVQTLRQDRDKLNNATARVDAAIGEIVQDGVAISEEQRQKAIKDFLATGDFDIAETVAPVEATTPEVVAPAEQPSSLESFVSDMGSLFGSARRQTQASQTLADIKAKEEGRGIIKDIVRDVTGLSERSLEQVSLDPREVTEQTLRLISPNYRKVRIEQEQTEREAAKAEATRVLTEEQGKIASLEERLGKGEFGTRASRVLGGVAGQPTQALPVVGGVVGSLAGPAGATAGAAIGSIPLANEVYNSSYQEARDQFGATPEEATDYARAITAVEFGVEAVGGKIASSAIGRLGIKKMTKEAAQEGLTRVIKSRTARVAGAAVAEGVGEAVTELTGDVVREGMEAADTLSTPESRQRLKEFNARQTVTRLDRVLDAAIGGAGVGTAVATPAAHIAVAAEAGRQEAATLGAAQEGYRAQTKRAREQQLADVKADTELNEDIRLEQERIAQEQAKEDAFKKAEQDRVKAEEQAARQKSIEEEAAFRTIETEAAFRGQTRIERAGDTLVERVPVNPPAETTPEQVQAEREQKEADEADRVNRVELGGLTEQLRKRKESLAKKGAEQQAKDDKKAKSAETRRQRVVMDQLIAENPDADPADLAPLMRSRLATPVAATPAVEQAAPTTTEELTAPAKEVAPATVPDKNVPESELDALAGKLGLESKDQSVKGTVSEDFQPRLKRAIKGLVRKNTQQTADVQNLIRQKKLVFAPNPQAIGRDETGAASYDTATGQMYIYLDRTDPDQVVPMVANALHEATHAGQFNDREGRPSILKQMMGQEKYNAAKAAILAADGKNDIATKAVRAAKAADPDVAIQDLELVPYFVSEAVKARGGLGRLGGAVRDIKAGAREFIRKNINADLDVTLDEIDAAAQRTAGEIVSTEVQQADGRGGTLNIIAGPSSTGFAKAQQQGLTYKGFVDQGERFEIPDQGAEILDPEDAVGQNAYHTLLDGQPVDLEDFLVHPELYQNYPKLKKAVIKVGDNLGTAWGSYNEAINIIRINRNLVVNAMDVGATEFLRNIILHETQHAVQSIEGFVPGTSNRNFMPRGLEERKKAAESKVTDIVNKFELGAAVKSLDFETKKAWDFFLKWAQPTTLKETSALFLNNPEFVKGTSDRAVERQADTYRESVLEYNELLDEWNKANTKAYNTYLRDYGETEARNTEFRSRMTKAEREAKAPEQTMKAAPGNIPVERTLDTTPFVGGARALPEASPILNAAVDTTNERRWVPQIVTRLFDAKQGTSREIGEIVEFAASSPAEARMIAEASLSKYDVALKREAKRRGTTPEQLNTQITAELEAVDKTENSYEQNKAAFTAVASKYGQAGQSLIDMRNQIDDLTMGILRQRAEQNKPLTDKEKKLYQTLRNNMGRYTHRQYAVNAGKMGDKYSKEIWKAYEKVKQGRRHDAKDLANFHRVADAVKYLVDEKLYIPANEELANMSADQTRSLYNVWGSVGNPEGMSVDAMKDELATIRDAVNGDKGRLEAAAESIAQELLGLMPPQKALTNYFRGGKEDRAILKERQVIPAEIRKLMGEITDPSMRLMLTAAKQAEFVARNKMLLELTKQTGKDIQPPDAAGTPAVKGMQRLSGEHWGPMEGYYVSDNMRALVGDVVQQIATFEQALALAAARPGSLTQKVISEGINKFGKVAGVSKVMQIVGNPINFIYNLLGASRMLLSNGNINPINAGKALKTSIELIAYAISPATATKEAIRMNKYGVTDSAFIGELKGAQYQQLGRLIKGMTGKTHTQAMATLREVGVGAKELYAMMDVWSKLANFYNQVDVLTDFYKAEGIPRTEEQINREAADKVNATNITYKRAAPLIKDLERGGITQFGTYFYEVFRSEISNFMMGLEELAVANNAETPEGRRIMATQSAKRLTGQALSWGLTAAVAKTLGEVAFGEDEEEESYLRSLLPDFMQNQDFWPIGKDKDGNTVLFNVARLDPVGPITDIMRTMMQEDADLEAVGKNLFDLYIAPRVGTQIIKAIASTFSDDVRPSREPAIKQLAPGLWSDISNLSPAADRVDRAWMNVLEAFMPGIVTSWRDTNVHPEMNNAGDIVPAVSSYLGASMYKLDPKTSAKYASMDYASTLKNARKNVKEIFDDHPEGLPAKQLAARINELEAKEHDEFNKVVRIYRGMLATGMTPREAGAVFKDMRLAADAIKDIKTGEFNSRVVSKDSLKQYETQELANADRKDQKEIKAKWKNIYQMLEEATELQDEK